MTRPVHVMVAILRDRTGRVLITQRPPGKMQAGRWEFPGGKLEACEAPEACLRRELLEELGVVAGPMRPLIRLEHDYGEFRVLLDVRDVEHFGGEPRGRERQQLKWVIPEALPAEDILEADRPIIQALRLPDACLITPDPDRMSRSEFLDGLSTSLAAGIRLVQLRAPSLDQAMYLELAHQALEVCRQHSARLLLNAAPIVLRHVPADGIHLTSRRLMRTRRRPVPKSVWLSASCHSQVQLQQATTIQADFSLVSPVAATPTHPDAAPLGWAGFRALAARATMPVFALAGMSADDIDIARRNGARGVAAIRGLWKGRFPS